MNLADSFIHQNKPTLNKRTAKKRPFVILFKATDEMLEIAQDEYEYEPPSKYYKDGISTVNGKHFFPVKSSYHTQSTLQLSPEA